MPANPGYLPDFDRPYQHDDPLSGRPHAHSAFDDPVWEPDPVADEDYPDHGRDRMYRMFESLRDPAHLNKIECEHVRTMMKHGPHDQKTYEAAKNKRRTLRRLGHLGSETYDYFGCCPQGIPISHIEAAFRIDGLWGDLHAVGTFYEFRTNRVGRYNAEEEAVVFMILAYECVRLNILVDGCTPRADMQAEPVDADVAAREEIEKGRCRPSVLHHLAETDPDKYLTEVPRQKDHDKCTACQGFLHAVHDVEGQLSCMCHELGYNRGLQVRPDHDLGDYRYRWRLDPDTNKWSVTSALTGETVTTPTYRRTQSWDSVTSSITPDYTARAVLTTVYQRFHVQPCTWRDQQGVPYPMSDADFQRLLELTYPGMPPEVRQQVFCGFFSSSTSLDEAVCSGDSRDLENYPLAETGRVQHAAPYSSGPAKMYTLPTRRYGKFALAGTEPPFYRAPIPERTSDWGARDQMPQGGVEQPFNPTAL